MMLKGKKDEDEEKIREKKSAELEIRQDAMVKRCENKQTLRRLNVQRREAQKDKIQRVKEPANLKLRRIQQTHRLAQELSRRKQLEELLRSHKPKSPDKVPISCTLEKIQSQETEEKVKQEAAELLHAWKQDMDHKEKQRKEAEEKKENYKRDLQNQLIDNRRRFREKEEEKHRERKILEEVGEVIRNEEVELERRKKETAEVLQSERIAFLRARQIWKEKRKDVLRKEYEEIARVVIEKEANLRKEMNEKVDARGAMEALIEKLGKKLMDEEYRRKEREEICRELYLAEKETDVANEVIRLAQKKKTNAKNLLQDMVRHQKAVAERKAKEDSIDAAFARYLVEEQRTFREKEEQKEQARREKNIQYGNELRQTITNRAKLRMEASKKQLADNCSGDNVTELNAKKSEVHDNLLSWKTNDCDTKK